MRHGRKQRRSRTRANRDAAAIHSQPPASLGIWLSRAGPEFGTSGGAYVAGDRPLLTRERMPSSRPVSHEAVGQGATAKFAVRSSIVAFGPKADRQLQARGTRVPTVGRNRINLSSPFGSMVDRNFGTRDTLLAQFTSYPMLREPTSTARRSRLSCQSSPYHQPRSG